MGLAVKILADSVSPDGVRLTTFEVTLARIVLAELNTHRWLSRNSASSHAIPVAKTIQRVKEDPYIPQNIGANQAGMQAGPALSERTQERARAEWLLARDNAIAQAAQLLHLGVHKQITNRLLEPFMWHTVIVSATEWSNFFHLRNHPDAHPDLRAPAAMMQQLLADNEPTVVPYGEWHLPLLTVEERRELDSAEPEGWLYWAKVSVGRCARVSYLTHDGERDLDADVALCERLMLAGHMSPFEHVATPMGTAVVYLGNFRGWKQYRKTIPGEADMLAQKQSEGQVAP